MLSPKILTTLGIKPRQNFSNDTIIETHKNDSVNNYFVKCLLCEKNFSKLSSLSVHFNIYHHENAFVKFPQSSGNVIDDIEIKRTEKIRAQNRLRVFRHRSKLDEKFKSVRQSLQCWTDEEKLERKKELARQRIKRYRSFRKTFIKTYEAAQDKLYKIERFRELNRFRVQRHRAKVRAETEKEAILIEIGLIQSKTEQKDVKALKTRAVKHKSVNSPQTFMCAVCGKTFKNRHSLKFHENMHEVKRFKCDLCEKYFLQSELYKHLQISHRKDKSHSCVICGNEYKYKSSLRTHSKIHQNQQFLEPTDYFSSFQHTDSTVDFSCLGLGII